MMTEHNFNTHARHLLAVAGLPVQAVIHERALHSEHFGDAEISFRVGPMHVRFDRDRGQEFVDVCPASIPGEYFQFGDLELAMGWKTVDEECSKSAPEPLSSIVDRLRAHYPQIQDAFSSTRARDTVAKLSQASRQRGAAFVDHLRRIAEKTPKE